MKRAKRCTKCGIEKSFDNFNKYRARIDGLQIYCRPCRQAMLRAWRESNPDRQKRYDEKYRNTHREKRREYDRQWRQKNRDYWRNYQNERLHEDLNYRLHNYISRAIRRAIKKNRKSAFDILGYSVDELRHHLELLFQPGMTWENYGAEWHIDHVVPKSWFNLETLNGRDEYELRLCWSLPNLQPLWATENLEKKNKQVFQINRGALFTTYDQFRTLIELHKRDQDEINITLIVH